MTLHPNREPSRTRLRVAALFVLALAAGLIAGCTRPPPAPTLRVGLIGALDSLSPAYDRTSNAVAVQHALYRGLLEWSADGTLRTAWATEVPSATRKTFHGSATTAAYTVRLRKDAAWSDGRRLTFDDFLFSYRLLVHPLFRGSHAWWTSAIRGFNQTGDDLTITVDRAGSIDGLALFPLPHDLLAGSLDGDPPHFAELAYHQKPVGDGPYRLERRTPDEAFLIRNDQYTPRPAIIERIAFQRFDTSEEALAALAEGRIDVVDRIPLDRLPNLREGGETRLLLTPGPRLVSLVFNTRAAPFNDASLRRAMAQGANRPAVVAAVGANRALAADSWIQSTCAGYSPVFASYRGDLQTAQRNVRASAWRIDAGRLVPVRGAARRTPLPLAILFDAEAPDLRTAATALQLGWRRLGIEATLVARPRGAFLTELRRGAFTVALVEMEVYPWTEPSRYFSEESIPTERNNFRGANVSGWTSRSGQRLLAKIDAASCPSAVSALVTTHAKVLAQEVPILPLYFTPLACGCRASLKGLAPRSYGGITWNLEEWRWK